MPLFYPDAEFSSDVNRQNFLTSKLSSGQSCIWESFPSFWCSTPEQNPLGTVSFFLFTYCCSLLYKFPYLLFEHFIGG
jgi:hypothetical protein